jgi:hypothetical protein
VPLLVPLHVPLREHHLLTACTMCKSVWKGVDEHWTATRAVHELVVGHCFLAVVRCTSVMYEAPQDASRSCCSIAGLMQESAELGSHGDSHDDWCARGKSLARMPGA